MDPDSSSAGGEAAAAADADLVVKKEEAMEWRKRPWCRPWQQLASSSESDHALYAATYIYS